MLAALFQRAADGVTQYAPRIYRQRLIRGVEEGRIWTQILPASTDRVWASFKKQPHSLFSFNSNWFLNTHTHTHTRRELLLTHIYLIQPCGAFRELQGSRAPSLMHCGKATTQRCAAAEPCSFHPVQGDCSYQGWRSVSIRDESFKLASSHSILQSFSFILTCKPALLKKQHIFIVYLNYFNQAFVKHLFILWKK